MKANETLARKIAKVYLIPYFEDFVDALATELDYAVETHGEESCVLLDDVFKQFDILDEEVSEVRAEVGRSGKSGDRNRTGYIPEDKQTNYKLELMQVAATVFQMYASQQRREGK